jgi:hypothetical protein
MLKTKSRSRKCDYSGYATVKGVIIRGTYCITRKFQKSRSRQKSFKSPDVFQKSRSFGEFVSNVPFSFKSPIRFHKSHPVSQVPLSFTSPIPKFQKSRSKISKVPFPNFKSPIQKVSKVPLRNFKSPVHQFQKSHPVSKVPLRFTSPNRSKRVGGKWGVNQN